MISREKSLSRNLLEQLKKKYPEDVVAVDVISETTPKGRFDHIGVQMPNRGIDYKTYISHIDDLQVIASVISEINLQIKKKGIKKA